MKKYLNSLLNSYIIFIFYSFIGWLSEVLLFLIRENRFENRGVLFGPFLPIYGFGILILLFFLGKFIKKKHLISNKVYLNISIVTVVTFIFTTIIEYSTKKIYRVDFFINHYGLFLFLINLLFLVVVNYFVDKKKDVSFDTTVILVFLLVWIIATSIEYVSHYYIEKYSHKLLWDYTHNFLNINRRVNWDASRNFAFGGTFALYVIQPRVDKLLNNNKFVYKVIICLVVGIPMIIDLFLNVIFK